MKQLGTILYKFATFSNSVYWTALPQHIVAFNIPFPKPEGTGEYKDEEFDDDDYDEDNNELTHEMGFPFIPDYKVYSLFPSFVAAWSQDGSQKEDKKNEAYMSILHSMLSIDTFADYVKEQFDLHRNNLYFAKTEEEKKKAEKMHNARMEFASKLAFFPSSRVMYVRGYLTDMLRNCANVPFACRFMIDMIRQTQKFIKNVENNPRLKIKSDGLKHHFSLTKNLPREVKGFVKIVKQVELQCKNELKVFEDLLLK